MYYGMAASIQLSGINRAAAPEAMGGEAMAQEIVNMRWQDGAWRAAGNVRRLGHIGSPDAVSAETITHNGHQISNTYKTHLYLTHINVLPDNTETLIYLYGRDLVSSVPVSEGFAAEQAARDFAAAFKPDTTKIAWSIFKANRKQDIPNTTSIISTLNSYNYITLPDRVQSITGQGNFVTLFAPSGTYHLLWLDGGYRYVNEILDKAIAKFTFETSNQGITLYDNSRESDFFITKTTSETTGTSQAEIETKMLQAVSGLLYKKRQNLQAEGVTDGYFFAMAALRLFDGSYIKFSSPALFYGGFQDANDIGWGGPLLSIKRYGTVKPTIQCCIWSENLWRGVLILH